jgi:hypothetical protein
MYLERLYNPYFLESIISWDYYTDTNYQIISTISDCYKLLDLIMEYIISGVGTIFEKLVCTQ